MKSNKEIDEIIMYASFQIFVISLLSFFKLLEYEMTIIVILVFALINCGGKRNE